VKTTFKHHGTTWRAFRFDAIILLSHRSLGFKSGIK